MFSMFNYKEKSSKIFAAILLRLKNVCRYEIIISHASENISIVAQLFFSEVQNEISLLKKWNFYCLDYSSKISMTLVIIRNWLFIWHQAKFLFLSIWKSFHPFFLKNFLSGITEICAAIELFFSYSQKKNVHLIIKKTLRCFPAIFCRILKVYYGKDYSILHNSSQDVLSNLLILI